MEIGEQAMILAPGPWDDRQVVSEEPLTAIHEARFIMRQLSDIPEV